MEVDDVSITSLNFGKEFTDSIEAKQIAQQDAERSKFVVEKAEQEKQAAIIGAQVIFTLLFLLPFHLHFLLICFDL